jgi:hypothetical protein
MKSSKGLFIGLLLGSCLGLAGVALAQPDVRTRAHMRPVEHSREVPQVDGFHRVPPGMRSRGAAPRISVRVNPFHSHLGWRVTRFSPRERAAWTHGHWWHGRHNGRLGWWWWAGGGWFFYDTPAYPYPDYVSEYAYEEPAAADNEYWYYCRDPEGYYPYVKRCYGSWEPVPAQPDSGYGDGDYDDGSSGGYDQGGPDEMGPNGYGPPDRGAPDEGYSDDQGPPDEGGPPDEQGSPPR